MTVDYTAYMKEKTEFIEKHSQAGNYFVDTSVMDEYGRYHKEYIFEDGAIFYEMMGPEYVEEIVEVKMCRFPINVKLFKTEFWSSDNAESKNYYETY